MRAFRSPLPLYLAVVALAFLACDMMGSGNHPSGDQRNVQVNVTNGSHQPLVGVPVTIAGTTVTTGADGTTPVVLVDVGEQTITANAPGYNPYSNTFDIQGATTLRVEVRGPNQVTGQVVNSQDGQPVSNAAVTFARGGHVELTETTGSTGFFNIVDAPDGAFTLCITATGFVEFCRPNVQITGGSFTIDPVAVTSAPPAGAYRIVLTWGDQPSDLDAHLTGPDGGSGRFHVYFSNRSAGGATLDHDDTSANGPETLSINVPNTGMYRFSVFNYSTQSTAGAAGIGGSPTRVEVYSSSGLIKSYTAPTSGSGNTWRVFEMTMNGSSATFNDNGGASLGYVTATGSGDTGTFLTDGPTLEVVKR